MLVDYDLSNLATDQIEMWLRLRPGGIRKEIMAVQAERLGLPFALGCRMGVALIEKPQPIFNNVGRAAER